MLYTIYHFVEPRAVELADPRAVDKISTTAALHPMSKIVFSQAVTLDLTRRLQLVLLDSLMASGSWDADSLRFQGGTSLSLVYGSPRFSEDLDFIAGSFNGLNRMLAGASNRMKQVLRTTLPGADVKFGKRDDDPESFDARNPRTFTVTVSHPDWYRAVKIKVEFWICDPTAVAAYEAKVLPARVLAAALDKNPLRTVISPVLVPAATLEEICVDKLHALVGRSYLKHRDVFDLWWLEQQGAAEWSKYLLDRYAHHAAMYAESVALPRLSTLLAEKATIVQNLTNSAELSEDLQRWLGEDSTLAQRESADAIAEAVAVSIRRCVANLSANANPLPSSPSSPLPSSSRRRPRP